MDSGLGCQGVYDSQRHGSCLLNYECEKEGGLSPGWRTTDSWEGRAWGANQGFCYGGKTQPHSPWSCPSPCPVLTWQSDHPAVSRPDWVLLAEPGKGDLKMHVQ